MSAFKPDKLIVPGITLLETLESLGFTQANLAVRTNRSRKHVNEVIKGKAPITPEFSLELETVTGVPASFWNSLERKYQEHKARLEDERERSKYKSWVKSFPLKEMIARNLIRRSATDEGIVHQLLTFFQVASPASAIQLIEGMQPSFRQSQKDKCDYYATAVWLQQGEREAQRLRLPKYDRDEFVSSLESIRNFTTLTIHEAITRTEERCNAAGVAFLLVREFPRTYVCGATRWLTPSRPLIQLSLRYKSDDMLWFAFFHEAAHILKHNKELFVDFEHKSQSDKEREADAFAANTLIPPRDFQAFIKVRLFSYKRVTEFAHQIGIAPGIVVGRLQHEGLLPRTHLNHLKRKLEWAEA